MKFIKTVLLTLIFIFFNSIYLSEYILIDTNQNVGFSGIESGVIRCFKTEITTDSSLSAGNYKVTDKFSFPEHKNFTETSIPNFITLDNGIIISDDRDFGDLIISSLGNSSFFEDVEEVFFINLPWEIHEEFLRINSGDFLEYLPAFLVQKGFGIYIDKIFDSIEKKQEIEEALIFPLTSKKLDLNLSVSSLFKGIPFIPVLNSSRELSQVQWIINDENIDNPMDFIPKKTGKYVITVEATDILGFSANESVNIFVTDYEPPVQTRLIFDKCEVGEQVLFLGDRKGYWQILDEMVYDSKLRWEFEAPGEYDVYFCEKEKLTKYRIIVK